VTDHRDDFEVLLERAYLHQPIGGKHESARKEGEAVGSRSPNQRRSRSLSRQRRSDSSRLELFSQREFEEGAKLVRARRMPQLAQRLGFDLADALAGDGERLADFFERV
jgi:hypothetical protein